MFTHSFNTTASKAKRRNRGVRTTNESNLSQEWPLQVSSLDRTGGRDAKQTDGHVRVVVFTSKVKISLLVYETSEFPDTTSPKGLILSLRDDIGGSLSVKLVNDKVSRKIEYGRNQVSANVPAQKDLDHPM